MRYEFEGIVYAINKEVNEFQKDHDRLPDLLIISRDVWQILASDERGESLYGDKPNTIMDMDYKIIEKEGYYIAAAGLSKYERYERTDGSGYFIK